MNKEYEKDYKFDEEILTDEQAEEELDALIECIKEQIDTSETKSSILDAQKLKMIAYTYKVLKYITKGTKAKVVYKLNKPFQSMGSVSVTGKDIMFKNPKWFVAAVKLASNFNVYPKTDGSVRMDFTFHQLTVPLE